MEKENKPFNNHQYEYLNGRYVKKKDYDADKKKQDKEIQTTKNLANTNLQMLNITFSIVKFVFLPVSLYITYKIIDLFISN